VTDVEWPNVRATWALPALVAAAAFLAVAYAFASPASKGRAHPKGPREATVSVHGHTVRAALGTNCLPGERQGEYETFTCADAFGTPGTRRRLAIAPRDRVRVTLGARAKRVTVGLVRPTRRGDAYFGTRRAHRRAAHPRQWLAHLPRRLRQADRLDVAVLYSYGDADFGVSVRRRR
jgi:hypothetical protein